MAVATVDRAAAVRQALRALVAQHGFHGASMSAVAAEAGVATGTAYTHYASKDELVLAAYLETKAELAEAATASLTASERSRSGSASCGWAIYRHLRPTATTPCSCSRSTARPTRSPRTRPRWRGEATRWSRRRVGPEIAALLLPLPLEVLYELGLGPAVRLAAGGEELTPKQLRATADACWRAVSRE